jgi:hypothetical protein
MNLANQLAFATIIILTISVSISAMQIYLQNKSLEKEIRESKLN